jgi:hypothetical protein
MLRIICCLMVISPILLRAQAGTAGNFVSEGKTTVLVFDANGNPFSNPPADIAGNPFLQEGWQLGSVVLPDNRRFDSVRIRLNLETQQVHFLNKDNKEIALFKGYIKIVVFYNGVPGEPLGAAEYASGFPAIDQQDETSFYEVLSKGKLLLLKSQRKIISKEKNEFSGETRREYVSYDDYYIYGGNQMQRIRKDKSDFLNLVADKRDRMEAFINSNHLKLKSANELKKAIDYYDSL